MQQRWWLVAAGVVGVGLAILLFPRPDTGEDVPDANPRNIDPLEFKSEPLGALSAPRVVKREPNAKRDLIAERAQRTGPNPIALEYAKARDNPASLYAGRASGPWAVIKRQLSIIGTPEALAFGAEINPLVADLRMLRRDPRSAKTWDELESAQKDLHSRLAASEFAKDELLATSLGRVENYIADYHTAMAEKAAEDAKGEGSPDAGEPGSPQGDGGSPQEEPADGDVFEEG